MFSDKHCFSELLSVVPTAYYLRFRNVCLELKNSLVIKKKKKPKA